MIEMTDSGLEERANMLGEVIVISSSNNNGEASHFNSSDSAAIFSIETVNFTSSSSFSLEYECRNSLSMNSVAQFLECFRFFLSQSVTISCLVLLFAILTAILNVVVILFISRLKHNQRTVFDKIFIGHAIVDGLVGLLVIPNYCIYSVFGYWPLGKLFCHFYVSLDYTICHVGILHMVYIAYARLRSLIRPKQYKTEFFIHHAKLTMFLLWIVSAIIWLPGVNLIINLTYEPRQCYFNFDPIYIILQDTLAYMLPMFFILAITGYILKVLHAANKRRRLMKRRRARIQGSQSAQLLSSMQDNAARNFNYNMAKALVAAGSSNIFTQSIAKDICENELRNEEMCSVTSDREAGTSSRDESSVFKKASPLMNNSKRVIDNSKQEEAPAAVTISTEVRKAQFLKKKTLTLDLSMESLSRSITLDSQINSRTERTSKAKVSESHSLSELSKKGNSVSRQVRHQLSHVGGNLKRKRFKLNPFTKLYLIIAAFVILWLPFCILWPIKSICENCIPSVIWMGTYWMGYAQSLINPALLLILNPNYKEKR